MQCNAVIRTYRRQTTCRPGRLNGQTQKRGVGPARDTVVVTLVGAAVYRLLESACLIVTAAWRTVHSLSSPTGLRGTVMSSVIYRVDAPAMPLDAVMLSVSKYITSIHPCMRLTADKVK